MLERLEVSRLNSSEITELPVTGVIATTDPYQIRNIEGLGPIKATVNTSQLALPRGDVYIGHTVSKRNIVMTVGLNPDWETTTPTSLRRVLSQLFTPGEFLTLRFFMSDILPVKIDGIVEACEPVIFSKDPEIQISIICPDPDFIAVDGTIVNYENLASETVPVVETLEYEGTASTGAVIELHLLDSETFSGDISITKQVAGPNEVLFLNDISLDTSAFLRVSSVPGDKFIRRVVTEISYTDLLRNVSVTDLAWPLLTPGDNIFSFYTIGDNPHQLWTVTYFARFGGL
jgi:hypothetical protein